MALSASSFSPADPGGAAPGNGNFALEILRNLLVALSVSFVALSLGAAFGVLSGRGAFNGMLSAGLIALIAAALGGARVQCSGPIAPTAAIMAALAAAATARIAADPAALGGMTADHFLNLICFLCGGFMVVMAVLRAGRLIALVPGSVLSGFMIGIGLMIWTGQMQLLFGIGRPGLGGGAMWNAVVAFGTFVLTFLVAPVLGLVSKRLARFVPATLVALVLGTLAVRLAHLPVELLGLDITLKGAEDVLALVKMNLPQHITWDAVRLAWRPGLELALVAFLDTMMVVLVLDRLRGETARKNKELFAQGVANAATGLIGGVPGTLAGTRSVLMVQEGASMRLAGMLAGIFVIAEMLLFQDYINMIPKAVFVGILLKVGWTVMDKPLLHAMRRMAGRDEDRDFSIADAGIAAGTALVTLYNVALAILLFTVLDHILARLRARR